MERFKDILRKSVSSGAHKIILRANHIPVVVDTKNQNPLNEFGPVQPNWLQTIYNFLFQKDLEQINRGLPTKGALNIPNLGQILLIGHRQNPDYLELYLPPEGVALFEKKWQEIQNGMNSQNITPNSLPVNLTEPSDPLENSLQDKNSRNFSPIQTYSPIANNEQKIQEDMPIQPIQDIGHIAFSSDNVETDDQENLNNFNPVIESPKPLILEQNPPPQQPASDNSTTQKEAPYDRRGNKNNADRKIIYGPLGDGKVSGGENSIDNILKEMISKKASDLHLVTGQPIIYRIDGSVTRRDSNLLSSEQLMHLLDPIIPPSNKVEFIESSDTDFAYEISSVGRFRVNLFRNNRGVGAVLRHIPATILTAEQLGIPPSLLKFCQLSKGLVLVTGPTGSGKSTTLAAMLDHINKTRAEHLLTIEDPIEFVHTQQKCLVNQREVGRHTKSFAKALKAALREDPDIILIGEMRDLETIHIAIETAETGHLVFGTLHTTTAVSTIDRIIDQFPSDQQEQIRVMLSTSLKGVVSQTLLKKKGGGRLAAHEILVLNEAVGNMIRENKPQLIQSHMQTQKSDGNILLNESLTQLLANGLIEFEDAYLKSVDKKGLIDLCKRKGIKMTLSDGEVYKAS
ncbi:MAG: type IV pilus twitching motility protein PilT [Bdellovibrionota bacterium]